MLLLLSLLTGSASAQVKIGTVDLRKIFEGYYKKKQAEVLLKDREAEFDKGAKEMQSDFDKTKEQYQKLMAEAAESARSTEARDQSKKEAEEKFKKMRELDDAFKQYGNTKREELKGTADRLQENIMKEIRNVVKAKAQKVGFTIVVDAGNPIFLYTSNDNDITDSVLLELNATALPDSTPSEDKPDKSGEKKKQTKNQ